jgi:RNA polymerase sigma factor FliA
VETREDNSEDATFSLESNKRIVVFNENVVLARSIARSLYVVRTSNDVEYQDYLHYAFAGLLEATDRYDESAGASFKTFASYRIRGSVLNGIGKFSEYREQSAFRSRLRKERLQALSKELYSTSRDSLFEEMVELTLGLAIGLMLEGASGIKQETESDNDQLQQKYMANKTKEWLLKHVDGLPYNERTVVQLHYFYHAAFVDIAATLSISKGRVSQIHNSAIKRLKSFFEPHDRLDHYL